jgi:hypothetical protein
LTELISVIVVNWNGLGHLQRCLPALLAQRDVAFEVILVDNGSDDESVAWLRTHYPEVRLLINPDNRGFAEANNQGIDLAQGDYVVLLNNDTVPDEYWLRALLSVVEHADDRVGMVASQITFMDRPHLLDSAGICVGVLGFAWNRHFGCLVADEVDETVEVFGPSGAAALYRRSLLQEIGGFDARYFMYYEDVDLAWRARRAGWRCLYAPRAHVLHAHSASGGKLSGFKAYYLGMNRWRTLFKHYPFARLWFWFPLLLILDVLACVRRCILDRNLAAFSGRFKAWQEWRLYGRERDIWGPVGDIVPWLSLARHKCVYEGGNSCLTFLGRR